MDEQTDFSDFISWIEGERKVKNLTMEETNILYNYWKAKEDAGYICYRDYSGEVELSL